MSRIVVLYIGDKYEEEERCLQADSIATLRVSDVRSVEEEVEEGWLVVVRGSKLNVEQYNMLAKAIRESGSECVTSTDSYRQSCDAESYAKVFDGYSPRVFQYHNDDDIDSIRKDLINREATFPLFVRSDVESAAKYVGVESCIARSAEDLEGVIDSLRRCVESFSNIIFKEVFPVAMEGEKRLEYRGVIVDGRVLCCEHPLGLPHPKETGAEAFLGTIARVAKAKGMDGAFFADVAKMPNDEFFVVECKSLVNGTINDCSGFSKGLKELATDGQ